MKKELINIVRNFCIISIATTSIALQSCDEADEADTTKPVITLIEPAEGAELRIGSEYGVHFEMDVEDNVALSSYKIDLHNALDGHMHSASANKSESATTSFSFNKTYDLEGKKNAHVHHHDILIPANATEGAYHLMVYVTDAAGNESHVARNITLSLTAEEDED